MQLVKGNRMFSRGRLFIAAILLLAFVAAMTWYVASGFESLPGFSGWALLTVLLILYVSWRSHDRRQGMVGRQQQQE